MTKELQKTEKDTTKPNRLAVLKKTVKSIHYPTHTQTKQAFALVVSCIAVTSAYLYLIDTGIAKVVELLAKLL